MKSIVKRLVLLILVISVISNVYADTTDVSGTWSTNQNFDSHIRVPAGQSLTILAGVEVYFGGPYSMIIDTDAILLVQGNETDSVVFTSSYSEPDRWLGLKFNQASSSSEIEYAVIKNSWESGIDIYASNILIHNCTIKLNGNPYHDEGGGGLKSTDSDVHILNNIIINNTSRLGGGLYCNGGGINVTGNVFEENESPNGGSGAGILVDNIDADGILSYNTVVDNTTTVTGLRGGGMALTNSSPEIFNNTFYGNYATIGGGIMLASWSQPNLTNNIFWNNDASDGPAEVAWDEYSEPDNNINYCDIHFENPDSTMPGTGNINLDPLFIDPVGPPDNFELSWYSVPDPIDRSPCIDAGHPEYPKDPDKSRIDMGALPYFHPYHLLGTINVDSTLRASLSPFYLMAPFTIEYPCSLYIEPGVQIEPNYYLTYEDMYDIVVDSGAVIIAEGTDEDSIKFTNSYPEINWQGLKFYKAESNCKLDHIIIEKACSSAVSLDSSDITICNSMLRENSNTEYGGAIKSVNSSPVISSNTFLNNHASLDGGAAYFTGGDPIITGNLFESDTAMVNGGAMFISGDQSNAQIKRNIFWKNKSGNNGGAVYCNNLYYDVIDPTGFTNNTFCENIADHYGGAVAAVNNSQFMLKNSILWNNIAFNSTYRHVYIDGSNVDYNYCDISLDNWSLDEDDPTNIYDDPLFTDGFNLQQGSPCIQRGDPDPAYNDPDDTRSDIGARHFPQGGNELSGEIVGNVVLAAPDTFKVTNDIIISSGNQLTIQAGVTLNFMGNYKMVVEDNGVLLCEGEISEQEREPDTSWVRFTSFDIITGWDGLEFNNVDNVNDSCKVLLTIFEHAKTAAIRMNACNTVIINGCKFQFNSGNPEPGAILVNGGAPEITYNYFTENYSQGNGGAIRLTNGTNARVERNVFWRNFAYSFGGAVSIEGCAEGLGLFNNTMSENRANTAGALFVDDCSPLVLNNIMWKDTAHYEYEIYANVISYAPEVDYCDIYGGWADGGENVINLDPLFADSENGDFHITWTNYPNDDYSKSPCIDAGHPDTEWFIDDDDTRVDIGALYFHQENTGLQYVPGDCNMALGLWPPTVIGGDVSYLVGYFIGSGNTACKLDDFWCSADVTGDCNVIGGDVSALVGFFIGTVPAVSYCPIYEPAWLGGVPDEMPAGWPNCDPSVLNSKVIPTEMDD